MFHVEQFGMFHVEQFESPAMGCKGATLAPAPYRSLGGGNGRHTPRPESSPVSAGYSYPMPGCATTT